MIRPWSNAGGGKRTGHRIRHEEPAWNLLIQGESHGKLLEADRCSLVVLRDGSRGIAHVDPGHVRG